MKTIAPKTIHLAELLAKASALPWSQHPSLVFNRISHSAGNCADFYGGSETADANLRLTLHAINHLPQLVEALEACERALSFGYIGESLAKAQAALTAAKTIILP